MHLLCSSELRQQRVLLRQVESTSLPAEMPPPRSSRYWSLAEFLGQRRVLGFGALLTWLVLFHLLVNVWLLCIFTSLLVVLGSWLGSRALLDANSLLHLEHFLPLGRVSLPPPSAEHEWRLNHEINSAVHKAVRDFVSSWYRTLLPGVEGEFEHAVRGLMLEAVMALKERARQVDRKALVQALLELYGGHLQSYMTAKHIRSTHEDDIQLWQVYREVDCPHPAVSSEAAELSYSRALVNLVLHVLVPYPQLETRTGAYMVTELVTCNVMLPLIGRVSDPDWLNQTIVDLFAKAREPQEIPRPDGSLYRCPVAEDSWSTCRSLSSSDHTGFSSSSSSSDLEGLRSPSSQGSMFSLASAGEVQTCHKGLLSPCRVNCCSLASGNFSSESKIASLDSLAQSDSEEDMSRYCDCSPSPNLCLNLKDDEDFGCFAPLKSLGPKAVVPEDSLWPAANGQARASPSCSGRACLTSDSLETPSSPTSSLSIRNLEIVGTVTAREQRGSTHPSTLYTVKFETAAEPEDGAVQPVNCHSVNRRYSEFLNLQTRLEEKPGVKKFIKSVKGPKKIFPDLPFGSADSEKVEARRGQLDTFLKQLSSIPETANSEDMQEFLALNSDGSTYFGRKPFVRSRIDKMMENALDTLKTAFPHPETLGPMEEFDGDADGRTMDNKKYRRLFPSKVSPSLNIPDLHPRVSYCYSEGSAVLNGMSLTGLESFVGEQERLLCEPDVKEKAKQSCELQLKEQRSSAKPHGTDTAVADVALNILCLLMKDQWSWLCTENIQKTIRLLFGTFIERWLEVGVDHLTSAPCWVIYLQVLQEAVWPGGTLPTQPQPERSAQEREATRLRCLECLLQLLPELVTDVLGSDKYRLSLETMLESVQDHHINKHLIFCLCGLLLEFLIPESCDPDFQKSLLRSLTEDRERESHCRKCSVQQ
ncbi:sorting nexin-19-like [Neosynchiropus ocellatus]